MQYAVTFCVCQGEEKQRYIVYVVTAQAGSGKISKKLLIAVAFRRGIELEKEGERKLSFSLHILLYLLNFVPYII